MKRWAILCILAVTTQAMAVRPVTVTHTTQADFAAATAENVVVWSLGEATLGRRATRILAPRKDVDVVSAVAVGEAGEVYVGTAAKGLILRIAPDGKTTTLADLDSVMVTDLLIDGRRLLAATAGENAGVYSIDRLAPNAKAHKFWADKDAGCVWALAMVDQTLYAATADKGKVYAIDAAGVGKTIFTAKQKTIRSIAATSDRLLVGAGSDGLVYQIDLKAKGNPSRVLLDAAEAEIVAVAIGADGNVYAAGTNVTSSAPNGPATSDGGKPATTTKPTTTKPATTKPSTTKPATTKPTTTKPAAIKHYTIKSGDSLGTIALNAYGTKDAYRLILAANPGLEPQTLRVGQKLRIPPAPSKAVKKPVASPHATPTTTVTRRTRPTMSSSSRSTSSAKPGNTVYRIDAEGMVKVVAKEAQTILCMALHEGKIVLGTSGAGRIQEINPAMGATGGLAKLDPKQITAIAIAADGSIIAGTNAPATVAKINGKYASTGTLISKPIDARQIARWSRISVTGQIPAGAAATIATRSGNVAVPSDATWSTWSAETRVTGDWAAIGSPAGRFIQYRLKLNSRGAATGVIDSVRLMHQVGNMAPEVQAVMAKPSAQPQPRPSSSAAPSALRYRIVGIKAVDPNGDRLMFSISFRKRGSVMWIQAVESLKTSGYVWDTQTVPDGVYQIKVDATDAASNSPSTARTDSRISRDIVVDNTPPIIGRLGVDVDGDTVNLTASVRDGSRIRQVAYVVDSAKLPVVVEPADGVFDSLNERITAKIKNLKPGPHVITVKAIDEFGNVSHAAAMVTIGQK